MFDLAEVMPTLVADVTRADCPCQPDVAVTEWMLVARRSDGSLRTYGSDPNHTAGLLQSAAEVQVA